MPQQQPSSTEIQDKIKANAALDSDIHREIAAQKRGTPESVERFWQSLPAWKVDQLTGRRGHEGR